MSHFENHKITDEEKAYLRDISRLPWEAHFHKTLDNPSAPSGKVDMYSMVDADTGETLIGVSISIDSGTHQDPNLRRHYSEALAYYIAGCCVKPWFIEPQPDPPQASDLAVEFNRAMKAYAKAKGLDGLDGQEIAVAALTVYEMAIEAMPPHSRQDFAHRMLALNNRLAKEDL